MLHDDNCTVQKNKASWRRIVWRKDTDCNFILGGERKISLNNTTFEQIKSNSPVYTGDNQRG